MEDEKFTPDDFDSDAKRFEKQYGKKVAYIWQGQKVMKSSVFFRPPVKSKKKEKMSQQEIIRILAENEGRWMSGPTILKLSATKSQSTYRSLKMLRGTNLISWNAMGGMFMYKHKER